MYYDNCVHFDVKTDIQSKAHNIKLAPVLRCFGRGVESVIICFSSTIILFVNVSLIMKRSRMRDTVKLTVCVSVCLFQL